MLAPEKGFQLQGLVGALPFVAASADGGFDSVGPGIKGGFPPTGIMARMLPMAPPKGRGLTFAARASLPL